MRLQHCARRKQPQAKEQYTGCFEMGSKLAHNAPPPILHAVNEWFCCHLHDSHWFGSVENATKALQRKAAL
jgi:hypothetical protein